MRKTIFTLSSLFLLCSCAANSTQAENSNASSSEPLVSSSEPRAFDPSRFEAVLLSDQKPTDPSIQERDLWIHESDGAVSRYENGAWRSVYDGGKGVLLPTENLKAEGFPRVVSEAIMRSLYASNVAISTASSTCTVSSETGLLTAEPSLSRAELVINFDRYHRYAEGYYKTQTGDVKATYDETYAWYAEDGSAHYFDWDAQGPFVLLSEEARREYLETVLLLPAKNRDLLFPQWADYVGEASETGTAYENQGIYRIVLPQQDKGSSIEDATVLFQLTYDQRYVTHVKVLKEIQFPADGYVQLTTIDYMVSNVYNAPRIEIPDEIIRLDQEALDMIKG